MSLEQRKLPTVLDLRALKGQKQLTMLRYFSLDEAAAAEAAGVDIYNPARSNLCEVAD